MNAIKNQSMLEDERMDERQKLFKKYRTQWADNMFATVGHIYSIIVEEMNIEDPDLWKFIRQLNEYIEISGDGFAKVSGPTDCFNSRRGYKLSWLLRNEFPNMTDELHDKIIKEVHGGYMF